MKLDSRIIEGKKPLAAFDIEEAKQFIDKEGYFTDCLAVFTNIKRYEKKWMLKAIDEKAQRCFKDADGVYWDYFLPAEWVKEKEPEPVWKPYDLDTLREDKISLGDVITFRRKTDDNSARIVTAIYNGRSENSDDLNDSEILLGGEWVGFQRLFEYCEIFDNKYSDDNLCRWRPFGYQE